MLCWSWLSSQDGPTRLTPDQIESDPLTFELIPPASANAKICQAGTYTLDSEYRLYFCVPDPKYFRGGHKRTMWIRLVPDPTFIPEAYK